MQAAIDNPIDSGGVEYYYQVDPSVATLALQNIADPMQGQNIDRYKDPTGVVLEETQTEKNQGEQIRYINNTSTVGPFQGRARGYGIWDIGHISIIFCLSARIGAND